MNPYKVDDNGNHHQNARTMQGSQESETVIDPALSAQLIDYERELAAEKEKSRSFKSRINEAADAFKIKGPQWKTFFDNSSN